MSIPSQHECAPKTVDIPFYGCFDGKYGDSQVALDEFAQKPSRQRQGIGRGPSSLFDSPVTHRKGPPNVISWFITPSNYSYIILYLLLNPNVRLVMCVNLVNELGPSFAKVHMEETGLQYTYSLLTIYHIYHWIGRESLSETMGFTGNARFFREGCIPTAYPSEWLGQ